MNPVKGIVLVACLAALVAVVWMDSTAKHRHGHDSGCITVVVGTVVTIIALLVAVSR